MTAAELEKLVNEDSGVIAAAQARDKALSEYNSAVANRDNTLAWWKTAEADINKYDKFWNSAKRKAKREEANRLMNEYNYYKGLAETKKIEYDSANSIYNNAKFVASEAIKKLQEASAAPEVAQAAAQAAASQAQSTSNIAKTAQITKDKIMDKLKANKKYIVWGLVAVVVVVTAIIVVKKYAK